MSENEPLSAKIYDDARDDAVSLLDAALDSRAHLRAALVDAGLSDDVVELVNAVAHRAQIVAMSDMIEHLLPVLTTALSGTDEFDQLEGLRMELLRTRSNIERV